MVEQKKNYYPLGDFPLSLCKTLQEKSKYSHRNGIMAMRNGEKRKPRKGEWYLSGAIVQAYYAYNDLDSGYYIARIVRIKKIETYVIDEEF